MPPGPKGKRQPVLARAAEHAAHAAERVALAAEHAAPVGHGLAGPAAANAGRSSPAKMFDWGFISEHPRVYRGHVCLSGWGRVQMPGQILCRQVGQRLSGGFAAALGDALGDKGMGPPRPQTWRRAAMEAEPGRAWVWTGRVSRKRRRQCQEASAGRRRRTGGAENSAARRSFQNAVPESTCGRRVRARRSASAVSKPADGPKDGECSQGRAQGGELTLNLSAFGASGNMGLDFPGGPGVQLVV